MLVVIGLIAIYSVCFVVIKVGLAYAPPLLFAGLRAFIGGVALLILAIALGQPWLPPSHQWGWIFVLAFTATTLTFGAMFLSPGRAGAGLASVLGNLQPLFAFVLATMFLDEWMTRGKLLTVALGLAGVSLISSRVLADSGASELFGAALALTVSATAAAGNVIFKRMKAQINILVVTAWQLIIGSLPLFLASTIVERTEKVVWNVDFVGLLLFLALVGTSLLNVTWFWLVQHGEVSHVSMYFFLVPVFGLGIAVLVFGERISLFEVFGSALAIAGIAVTAWESQRWNSVTQPV
jgi:O-acetylserine/cysteine efflux transporter